MKQTLGFLSIEMNDDTESKFIVDYINNLALNYPYIDMILFNSVYKRADENSNKFAVIHINEAKFFTGPIIVFNLKNMLFLNKCIGKKIFFSLRPEWISASNVNYKDLKNLYKDAPDILLIPTDKYKELYSLCWREPSVMEPSDYQKVIEYAGLQ